jgi:hypothetical protein
MSFTPRGVGNVTLVDGFSENNPPKGEKLDFLGGFSGECLGQICEQLSTARMAVQILQIYMRNPRTTKES